jgi:NAD(P)-dependent dehydrogenase (short-subunit alcohol dehydrogenase family)
MRTDVEGFDEPGSLSGASAVPIANGPPGPAEAGRSCRVVAPLGDDLSPLEPLLAHLRGNRPLERALAFPRGVLLEDGRLDLCKQGVGAAGAAALRAALRGNETVRDLLLGADHLGAAGVGEIASLVEERGRLRTVYLGCNAMGDEGATALARALRGDDAVRGLWLKRNGIGPAGARELASMLGDNRTLRTLDLVSNRLGPAGVAAIADALAGGNRSLEALYVCDNVVGVAGEALVRLLAAPGLRALFAGGNALGNAGALAFAPALASNSTLETLSLSSNGIGTRGLAALLAALRDHPTLRSLELGYLRSTEAIGGMANYLGDEGAELLASWLRDGARLCSLDLSGSHLGVAGAARVAEAALQCASLTSLTLGQRLPAALQSALDASLCRHANQAARAARSALSTSSAPSAPSATSGPSAPSAPSTADGSWRDDVARIRSVYRTVRRPRGAPALGEGEAVELTPAALRSLAGAPVPEAPAAAEVAAVAVKLPSADELAQCAAVLRQVLAQGEAAGAVAELAPVLALAQEVARVTRGHGAMRQAAERQRRRAEDLHKAQQTGIRQGRRARLAAELDRSRGEAALASPERAGAGDASEPVGPELTARLSRSRRCYVCKRRFEELDAFYDQLCPPCSQQNRAKRALRVDLSGRTALLTGGRIKIGFAAACLLLRAGARVIVTTRFPGDAARRFAAEPDHEGWADRLTIEPLDLRFLRDVERFADELNGRLDGLDILVHNAAQTIARPDAFYAALQAHEPALLQAPAARSWVRPGGQALARAPGGAVDEPDARAWLAAIDPGGVDEHGQPIDRRAENSWRKRLGEVDLGELVVCHAVNALAPFVLTGRLRAALVRGARRAAARPHAFVVNVSAVEGQFDRFYKSPWHPHTNMAKASLNMMTRTCADDLARDGVLMNSVDTGWITNENPLPIAERMSARGFAPPLDELDGAARVLDPVFTVLSGGVPVWGRFFKDYAEAPW